MTTRRRWENWEDRLVVDMDELGGAKAVADRIGRTVAAVCARLGKLHKLPCPFWVLDAGGRRIFCEQGDGGHWGTCCGGRSESEYIALGGASGWERSS